MKNVWRIAFLCMLLSPWEARAESKSPQVIPAPQSYVEGKGVFHWPEQLTYSVSGVSEKEVGRMLPASVSFRYVASSEPKGKGIDFVIDKNLGISAPEGYRLEVSSGGIRIGAPSVNGLFYGMQTLLQLRDAARGKIHACVITDEPRFAYRGVMLDVSRHFRSVDFLKKQIDAFASLKINRLHLHLTDAAGWRLEIKKYPRLTEFAAWRPQAVWKDWNKGGNQYCDRSDARACGGFYTQEEMRELIAYAQDRFITIVPEIEMPSHSEEVLAAYPELSCTHQVYGQPDYCVGNEKTFRFLEDVLAEVVELFPSEYIHIGGDEAGKANWKTCKLCQARMKEEGLTDVDQLQSYLVKRIERFLNAKGRNLLGWDEILQGGIAPGATVMSWRGEQGGIQAVRAGHRAIMTPGEYCYFDAYQDAPYSQPEAIGGYLPLHKVYGYNPVPDSLTVEEKKLIEGVQANLWTEYIPTESHAEYMLYPRVLALAEVAWTLPANKSWRNFERCVKQFVPRLQDKGYAAFNISEEIGNRKEALKPIKHLAVGKPVQYNRPYWRNYPANGEHTLTDGMRGGWNYNDKRWQGFVGTPRIDVVIDLEKAQTVHFIGADFMQICGPDVYMPAQVTISVSDDGLAYRKLAEVNHQVVKDDAVSFKNFGWKGKTQARYVRYQADADAKMGGVLFVDEIVVR